MRSLIFQTSADVSTSCTVVDWIELKPTPRPQIFNDATLSVINPIQVPSIFAWTSNSQKPSISVSAEDHDRNSVPLTQRGCSRGCRLEGEQGAMVAVNPPPLRWTWEHDRDVSLQRKWRRIKRESRIPRSSRVMDQPKAVRKGVYTGRKEPPLGRRFVK